jgi:hypothetical protein
MEANVPRHVASTFGAIPATNRKWGDLCDLTGFSFPRHFGALIA